MGLTSFDNFFSIWWRVESSRNGGYVTPGGWGGRAGTPDFKCRLTTMIEGCSWVWNVLFRNVLGRIIWQVFFWVVWFKCRDFLGILNNLFRFVVSCPRIPARGSCANKVHIQFLMFIFFVLYHLMLSGNFKSRKFGMDVFGGKFWVQGLFGVWISTLIWSCRSLKSRVLPWGMTTSTIGVGELNFEISDIGLGFKSESRIRSPPPPGDLGLSFFTRRMCNAGGVLNPG